MPNESITCEQDAGAKLTDTEAWIIQRRMAYIISKRDEIFNTFRKDLPLPMRFPEVRDAYMALYDQIDELIKAEAKCLAYYG